MSDPETLDCTQACKNTTGERYVEDPISTIFNKGTGSKGKGSTFSVSSVLINIKVLDVAVVTIFFRNGRNVSGDLFKGVVV